MSSPDKTFCIRPDYRSRQESTTIESIDEPGTYWNQKRLESAKVYQFEVYRLAYEIAAAKEGEPQLLDVGCGPPRKHPLVGRGKNVGVTLIDQPTVAELATRYLPDAEFYAANLETADLVLDKKFDVIICADVVEHLSNPDPCLSFIRQHLAADGYAVISTPERDRLYGPEMLEPGNAAHVREWNHDEFACYLASQDFTVEKHLIVHQKRPSSARRLLGSLLDRLGIRSSEFCCQVAICRGKA